jgi:hypothetical protein
MGFLDFFIEREETAQGNAPVNTPPPLTKNTVSIPPVPGTPSQKMGITEDDLQKFNQHFDDLFEKANLPGPDYFEFSKMCQAMKTLTEDVKFPAAFGGLQVQGLTKEKLVESANHYIMIIEEDSSKFNTAIDQKILAEVQNKRLTVENKRKSILEREEMIKNLQQEIEKESLEISRLEAEALDQEQKANHKATTYKAACEARKAMINSDLQKINNLIK